MGRQAKVDQPMNVVNSDHLTPPIWPEPFVLIIGPALQHAQADTTEQALRRMGLRPRKLPDDDPDPIARFGTPSFRLSLGPLSVRAGPAGNRALDAADPAHPSTSLLAASLPRGWRTGDQCWMLVPETDEAERATEDWPTRMREFFKVALLLIDLFDASHIFWSPALLWSDAGQFRASVAEMLASGMPPVLHLVAFRHYDTQAGQRVGTRGLSLFAGQELEGSLPGGWTVADMVKRLARLALDIMLNGPIGGRQRVRGLEAGEWITLSPTGTDGGGGSPVLVEFGKAH